MTFYINILLIVLIYVIGIDILGFWDEISSIFAKWLTKGKVSKPIELKPFSCSTCMSFWTNLIYTIATGHFSIINLALILVLSTFAPEIGYLLRMLKDWISLIIIKLTPNNGR